MPQDCPENENIPRIVDRMAPIPHTGQAYTGKIFILMHGFFGVRYIVMHRSSLTSVCRQHTIDTNFLTTGRENESDGHTH